ncbi:hypothetical protein [Prosthecodimorpha staleyi]|uniref:Uncharacterized protein n=1 Tax=Prosthecodimorpha staleyi TaxID=2840188 RepID=A0A947GDL9_9HYPH|nr:hypothetical protein [Prosthecodimorpha staleyi]MBT9290436.1 hypothetical protein [Prosthecodimorpha staleyi]
MRNLFLAAALILAATSGSEAQIVNKPPKGAQQCLRVDSTVGPNQTLLGKKCTWKYGCRCTGSSCTGPTGEPVYRNVVCTQLPG